MASELTNELVVRMRPVEYNRSYWEEDGPWHNEPDVLEWRDPLTEFPCLMQRNNTGAWCGYVGVPFRHRFFGITYDNCYKACGNTACRHTPEYMLSVHGGITYTGANLYDPYRRDGFWYIGFSTCRSGDASPLKNSTPKVLSSKSGPFYRDVNYVIEEVLGLAQQLKKIGNTY